jgi:hypothetical protein
MPVKFRCPECHRLIAVPNKMVGKTINCPHNGCLVQVRADQVVSQGGNGAASHFSIPVKLTEETRDLDETDARETTVQTGQWLRRNVARFIPGGGGPSATLAADGRLPELKLQEGQARRPAGDAEATNPLVMVGVLCLSFVISIALLLVDFDSPSGNSQQVLARRRLAEFYQQTEGPLAPYQQYLRDAQRAHSRGDEQTERQMYRRVLQLLRAEGRSRYASVTATPSEDRELEKLLATLMSEE